jgi:hypothetical protein
VEQIDVRAVQRPLVPRVAVMVEDDLAIQIVERHGP